MFSQSGQYFLRTLSPFDIDKIILLMFYNRYVGSVFTYVLICWWCNITKDDSSPLCKLVWLCQSWKEKKVQTFLSNCKTSCLESLLLQFVRPICKIDSKKYFVPTAITIDCSILRHAQFDTQHAFVTFFLYCMLSTVYTTFRSYKFQTPLFLCLWVCLFFDMHIYIPATGISQDH